MGINGNIESMQRTDINRIKEYINRNMSEKRRLHTCAVAHEAIKLARKFGENVEKAETAALFHDMFRGVSEGALNSYVRQLKLDPAYSNNCNLAHGKIAAIVMEKDYDISDPDIINAVSFHTTGRAGMSKLEKIIYLADAIEPNRCYPDVDKIRELAYKDLDKACVMSLSHTIDYIKNQGLYLDQDTVAARDYLIKKIERKEEER